MSNSVSALLSATYVEPGYRHVVELVHQRDPDSRRRLQSLDLAVWDAEDKLLGEVSADPAEETLDLAAVAGSLSVGRPRVMVTFDARYDERAFPYRPHHYAYLHRDGSVSPPLYYAVAAVLGGVPDRIDNSRINNFETYLFARRPFSLRQSLLLGNVARFAAAEAQIFAHYGGDHLLLCYCTNLTVGELRTACRAGRWPPTEKERTGKLCTRCLGDLNLLLREHEEGAST